MRDSDVRAVLWGDLLREHAAELPDTLMLNELGLVGEVRVDVAVLNGVFAGYEIKSERDTLRRLPKQVEVYSRVMDFATLVVADKHVDHALPLLPNWWGVITARADGGTVVLAELRPPHMNPSIEPAELALLLWRDEALAALVERGLDRGYRSKPRRQIATRLSEVISLDEMRSLVREQLKARSNWRADAA